MINKLLFFLNIICIINPHINSNNNIIRFRSNQPNISQVAQNPFLNQPPLISTSKIVNVQ